MRIAAAVIGLGLALLIVLAWIYQAPALGWAIEQQRAFQNAMASHLRALRAGEPGALIGFCTVCAGYGFVHALGPGHGKLVIGGAGLASGATAARLGVLAVVSSFAQAGVAIILVYGGFWLFGMKGGAAQSTAEQWMTPLSVAAIGLIGVILFYRGMRRLIHRRNRAGTASRHNHHPHAGHSHHGHSHAEHSHHGRPHDHHADCGHAHGPDMDQVAALTSWRDAVALVAAIAIRPCTGAIFVLAIAWPLGIALAGAVGVMAMGLGTAMFTGLVAVAGVTLRQSAVVAMPGWAEPLFIALQILVGLGIAWFSGVALLR